MYETQEPESKQEHYELTAMNIKFKSAVSASLYVYKIKIPIGDGRCQLRSKTEPACTRGHDARQIIRWRPYECSLPAISQALLNHASQ